ncbi:hypothetical protein EYF80_063691 [Liparis tanakae]|uniref:Uncharacterized protein n=1 Tax=Liparis tanakae TaxID=230148 RepID=A0A4Z2EBP3_9TELE|nr:hypothetical protein EYF80_063691 [Liparis tanakae]
MCSHCQLKFAVHIPVSVNLTSLLRVALVEDVGQGGDGGPPAHGEQVVVVAAGRQVEEHPFGRGAAVEQHAPHVVVLHQPGLLVRHHDLLVPAERKHLSSK